MDDTEEQGQLVLTRLHEIARNRNFSDERVTNH